MSSQDGRKPVDCPANFPQRYTVQSKDTMFFIAQRFNIPLNNLIAANPHIKNPNVLYPGDILCVPDTTVGRQPEKCPADFPDRYTVQSTDTMFFIAQRFGVSLDALIAANPHIEDASVIHPGDVLCVPKKRPRKPKRCPTNFKARYTVKETDTMFKIARKFGVSLHSLIRANPHIQDPNVLYPGDVLCVPRRLSKDYNS